MSHANHSPLSIEVLSRIIRQIDSAPTLFSLLTVNKVVFELAAKQLYRKVLNMPELSANKALHMLRQHFNVEWPRKNAPYIDYLRLLTDARFNIHTDVQGWKQGPALLANLDLRMAIIWAICGHRLSEITALQVVTDELRVEPFFLDAHLNKYEALERVEFTLSSPKDITVVQEFLKRFIKVNPRAKKLEAILIGARPDDIQNIRAIARLLAPPRSPRRIDMLNFVACHSHRKTVDFSQVGSVEYIGYPTPSMKEEHILKDLLPLCPQLETFVGNVSDPRVRMFGWAVNNLSSTKQFPSLRFVRFTGESLPALVAIDDALRGFASTLVRLDATIIDNLNFAKDHFSMKRFGAACRLPRLQRLSLDSLVPNVSVTLDPDAMPHMPMLKELVIGNPCEAPEEGMQYSEMLHHMYPINMWPVLRLPALTHLSLGGRAAAEFNPDSFLHMPLLTSLSLGLLHEDWGEYWYKHLWTWNWRLPMLEFLELEGAMVSTFTLAVLHYLPALTSLTLRNSQPYSVAVHKDVVELLELEGNVLAKQLKKIYLEGEGATVTKEGWEQLLGPWFPSLEDLKVVTSSATDHDVVRKARRHLRLSKLAIRTTGYNDTNSVATIVEEGWEKVDMDPYDSDYEEEEREWPKMKCENGRLLCRLNGNVYNLIKDA
ncbi:hypothetical protein BGW41_003261 [Actinomortierella wolfii]|nr:hypothetical protein BGW41_003261 [Actinomortierella wolfii]